MSVDVGHPEDICGRCGGPNLQTWHAPSPLWNTVMRRDGPEPFGGIVCPRCFGELAREAGVADHFCLTTHDAKVELPSVFGDGRVWDAESCRWVARLSRDGSIGVNTHVSYHLHGDEAIEVHEFTSGLTLNFPGLTIFLPSHRGDAAALLARLGNEIVRLRALNDARRKVA